jgi:hypothetical protein
MQVRRFFVHVDNRREDIVLADFIFHEADRLGEKGFDLIPFPALEKFWAGCDEGVYKHGTVLAGSASRRRNAVVNFLPVFTCGVNDVEIILAAVYVHIGIAGVLFFGAFVVSLQRPGWPRFVFGES